MNAELERWFQRLNNNLMEINKTLQDFLTQYHNYEGKK